MFEYSPGDAVLVAGSRLAALADIDPMGDLARWLVEACADETKTVDDVLEILLRLGTRTVENFAILELTEPGLRVVLRGKYSAAQEGQPSLTGRGLWADHSLSSVDATILAAKPSAVWLPLGQGVVLASACRLIGGRAKSLPEEIVVTQRAADLLKPPLEINNSQNEILTNQPAELANLSSEPQPDLKASNENEFAGFFDLTDTLSTIDIQSEIKTDGQSNSLSTFAEPLDPKLLTSSVNSAPDPSQSIGETRPVSEAEDLPELVSSPIAEPISQSSNRGFISVVPWVESPSTAEPKLDQDEIIPPELASAPSSSQQPHSTSEPILSTSSESPADSNQNNPEFIQSDQHMQYGYGGDVQVIATCCPRGHFNSPHAGICRICRLIVPPQNLQQISRPILGILRLSTGGTVLLDRTVLFGRNPRVPSNYCGIQPNLVRLTDPECDISNVHLEVHLDDWHVVVTDLGSTNGTQVFLPGALPITLRANDPLVIEPGTKVVLAGVFNFVYEAASEH